MSDVDQSVIKSADKDLAREASYSGVFFLIAWLFIIYTTGVASDLPVTSMAGIFLIGVLAVLRFVLGMKFDRLYQVMTPRRWIHAFGGIVLVNGAVWGFLNAIIVWDYFPSWPAYLGLMCTAVLAAGAVTTLNTHLRLLEGFHLLAILPIIIALIASNAPNGSGFGVLLLVITLFLMIMSRQLNMRYWDALRNAHQLREALHQADEANRAKSQFLSNMSHELRTPLNAMLGMAQIGKRISREDDAKSRFGHILTSGRHLLGIINEILDLSRLEARKLEADSQSFQLAAVVSGVQSTLQESAMKKGLDLTVECDSKLPEMVNGDRRRIQQILMNLVGNAIKFTRQGSVRLAVYPANEQVCFSVIDTGIGIDKSQVSRLFQPFEQAEGSNTRRYGGTGLGLAISNDLARLMGGEITVDSVPGQGSTFNFCLPLEETQQQPDAEEKFQADEWGKDARLAGLKVLAVDDDEFNRHVIREMLEYEGASVVLAGSGLQALDYLHRDDPVPFDVVMMDIQMPVMDGYEATRSIHEIEPDLPVVGLTAHAMPEERKRCLEAGMVAHIVKPVDADYLVTVLLQQLENAGRPGRSAITMRPPVGLSAAADEKRKDLLPGIDVDSALEKLKCDLPALQKLLLKFHSQCVDSSETMAALLAKGDIERARELAHGIKGSSGYMCALKLCEEASAMEEACKTGNLKAATERLAPFQASLEEVLGGIVGIEGNKSINWSDAPK